MAKSPGPGSLGSRVARTATRRAFAPGRRAATRIAEASWAPYSRLFVVDDDAGWALADERRIVVAAARSLGFAVGSRNAASFVRRQAIFHVDQFRLLDRPWQASENRVGVALYHGLPGTGVAEFDRSFDTLARRRDEIARVRVTHREMEDAVLATGIERARVFRIPIGVDAERFRPAGPEARLAARSSLGLPESAFVVGSFLKDGVGWDEGAEPKLIKGPDVLLACLELALAAIPELAVLLTGPARGYVANGLARLGIPYRRVLVERPEEVAGLYAAVDVSIVASRQEGGPKTVLEAMASGVPIVSTRVGQAADLIADRVNGHVAEPGDAEDLARRLVDVRDAGSDAAPLLAAARRTAEANDHRAQRPMWAALLEGFVDRATG